MVLTFLVMLQSCKSMKEISIESRTISQGWTYRLAEGGLEGQAEVPGTVHTDLMAGGLIEDPFFRTNEKDVQWVDKKDWEYSTTFPLNRQDLKKDHLELKFEGLDTYADIYLNDSLLLQTDNMFRRYRADIRRFAQAGENTLRIYFHSPIKRGLELLERSPYPYPAPNDQSENGGLGNKKVSIFTRKAGYHYGWDWGPRLVTSGIWRPVTLEAWDDLRIEDVFVRQHSVTRDAAELEFEITARIDQGFEGRVTIEDVKSGEIYAVRKMKWEDGLQKARIPVTIEEPRLWWSNGLGKPHLYGFQVVVEDVGRRMSSRKTVKTGLRSIRLLREKDSLGESFYFELNGVPVFAKGANYIPNDSFLPRVGKADYAKVVQDAVDAHMNMLRVWGGGIYEDDAFYELCDANGILVWQDFMFACAMYPGDEAFLENARLEAIDNVIRLRNHPSIALWCGNNENNTAWSYYEDGGWGWKERYMPNEREEINQAYLDLFHRILPEVVSSYTDGRDYWPSSPQAGYEASEKATYESNSGDTHYWGVWHGKHPFRDFDNYRSRFVSEYGFQSFPDMETVRTYTLPEDYDIESEVMSWHQRSGIGNLRIREYMGWDYEIPEDFGRFLYMSQVLQARGARMAIEAHRRARPYCMGTLYWQINDCWPVASWSSTDYYHRWKAMHYQVKRSYSPLLLSAFDRGKKLEVHAISDLLEDQRGLLSLQLQDFQGNVLWQKSRVLNLPANASLLAFELPRSEILGDRKPGEVFLAMGFRDLDNEILASNTHFFARPKDLLLGDPEIEVEVVSEDEESFLEIRADRLVRNLYLNFTGQQVFLADNYFDLLPGEIKRIPWKGESPRLENLELFHL